jgi:hypothetical protein
MVCEIVMDLIPSAISFFNSLFIGVSYTNYTGDAIGILLSVEIAACGLYYWRIFQVAGTITFVFILK